MNDDAIFYLKVGAPDSDSYELVAAEHIGGNKYLLIETPIQACGLNYGTTVSAVMNAHNELEITNIIAPSIYITRQFIRTASLSSREVSEKIASKVTAAGGRWETGNAGLAFVHLVKDAQFDLDSLFEQNGFSPLEITVKAKHCFQQVNTAA